MTGLVLLFALLAVRADSAGPFRAVEIDPGFEGFLRAKPLLMEVLGANVIRLHNGKQVVLAVASTVLKDDSGDGRLRAENVCKIKALASIRAEKQRVQVAPVEQVREKRVLMEVPRFTELLRASLRSVGQLAVLFDRPMAEDFAGLREAAETVPLLR